MRTALLAGALAIRESMRVPDTTEKASSEGIVAELAHMYGRRLSLAEIGSRYGHTADWVKARLVSAGVQIRSQGRQPAEVTPDQVRALLDQGLRVPQIADRLGVSETTVQKIIREQGWTSPPRRPRGPTRNAPPNPPAWTLRRLYVTEGLSIAEVAQRLGISRGRVTAALEAAGIPRHRPGWANGEPPPPITKTQLDDLYVNAGRSIGEVATTLNTTTTRVVKALRRHGIPRRPEPQAAPPPLHLDRTTMTELYVTQRLDDTAIGARYGVPAHRVTMRRRELQVRRPPALPPHPTPPTAPASDDLERWYVTEGRTLAQIARHHHTTRATVRTWLEAADVSVQPRTSREHRKQLDPDLLRDRYLNREWSAAAIAAELDTSVHLVLRTLHEHGIPVRRGGPPRRKGGDPAQQRLAALYDDSEVAALLRRHRIPRRPQGGTIAQRFPTPVRITRSFLSAAYAEIGLAASHIEQLTGQPAERVLVLLRDFGIPVRQSGAHSPWLRRQRDEQ